MTVISNVFSEKDQLPEGAIMAKFVSDRDVAAFAGVVPP